MKIAIIDYGMGNLNSIQSALKFLHIQDIVLTNDYKTICNASKLILPGVGSFANAMHKIKSLNLDEILNEVVTIKKKPILGICVGMQLMCKSSEEDGGANGLGFIDTECKKFSNKNLKIPHVGFNQVKLNFKAKMNKNLPIQSDFYFTHSFRLEINKDINCSICNYGEDFVASYEKNNIAGTQFHPELSQKNGLNLLKNFIERF